MTDTAWRTQIEEILSRPKPNGTFEFIIPPGMTEAIEALIQTVQEQTDTAARIDELNDLADHYEPYRPILDSPEAKAVREYATDRIAALNQKAADE